MPRPRKELVDVTKTPYYHITSRCVRRAFLCGTDRVTGTNYDHRKHWLEQRIRILSSIFALDVCAYAVMSNHYHLVVYLNPSQADEWSQQEIISRWKCLYRIPAVAKRFCEGESLTPEELNEVSKVVAKYKELLADLGRFMKALNEPIAKLANREDDCTGHFWESRYGSQAINTTAALLTSMIYVELNPVRAGLSKKPEKASYTSYRERLDPSFHLSDAVKSQLKSNSLRAFTVELKPLMAFLNKRKTDAIPIRPVVPLNFEDYRALMQWTCQNIQSKQRANNSIMPTEILDRLSLTPQQWLQDSQHFEALHRLGAFTRFHDRRNDVKAIREFKPH